MDLRAWCLLACALGPACGPGPAASDPTAGDASSGDSSSAPTTAPISTDPITTEPSTTEPSTTTASTTTGGECPVETSVFPDAPVRMMLVLERSSSMLTLWDHDEDPATPDVTRWSSLRRSLEPAVDEGAPWYDLGLVLFPGDGASAPPADDACSLAPAPQLAPVPHTADEFLAAVPPADAADLGGASPTRDALLAAVDALGPDGYRFLIYVGDGAPNCADGATGDARFESFDDATFEVLADALADGVTVSLIALDTAGPAAPPVVDGEPDNVAPGEFFGDAASLGVYVREALSEWELAHALGLDLQGPDYICAHPLAHPEWTIDHVDLDGVTLPQVEECAGEDAWFLHEDEPSIGFCGPACEQFASSGGIEIFFSSCDE